MLFLGFLDLHIDTLDDSEVEAHDSNTEVCAINMPSILF